MTADFSWGDRLALDVRYGYLGRNVPAPRRHNPRLILNGTDGSVLRILREEIARCTSFLFSVAFVSPRAIALLKQELVDFKGTGRIITSDYLGFNSPAAFAELYNLKSIGIDVRIHSARAFHPKGYIFQRPESITAMIGSSNLTENAIVRNHEWNLKVTAASDSDLAIQFAALASEQVEHSVGLTQSWIQDYAETYRAPSSRPRRTPALDRDMSPAEPADNSPDLEELGSPEIQPNLMQRSALVAIDQVRRDGASRAIIISATGTGKTILSALDVRAFAPQRMLFVVHREQILDRTIHEYQRVLGGPLTDFGKLSGSTKQPERRYLFATVQTLSQPNVLAQFAPGDFDYVIIDEAHRVGAASHRRLIEYFEPKFLLGMTATPERTDAFNVFELFDYNVPYEIRLNHALEEDMLSPFHYYGVADVAFENGVTSKDGADLRVLISPERVNHLIKAIETYGRAGESPRGLIFCGGKDEARALSEALNSRSLRGRPLRTVALTGDDSIPYREEMVEKLESGELDYILSVDVFNEGVDIPTINQVIMLRQTKSAIVFVQQLGRGLRKAEGKDYLVVIDFIGNYANNYLIPIALFGDESLNKESLRQNLIAAEETGVLPGLSSVRFDKISQERVLSSIIATNLDSIQNLKQALETMRNRLGQPPALWDFLRFESVDPVLLATKLDHYPALVEKLLRVDSNLTDFESSQLRLISHQTLPAKRAHELVLLDLLIANSRASREQITQAFVDAGLPVSEGLIESVIDSFTLDNHADADLKRLGQGVFVARTGNEVVLSQQFASSYGSSPSFRRAIDDLIKTGLTLIGDRYDKTSPFTPGRQYSRRDTLWALGLPRKWTSTLYGYKVDTESATCPMFVTLHKSDEVSASTAYEDELIDQTNMRWYTRSRRNLRSAEVRAIVENQVDLHVFVKKDDAEGSDFYYLGNPKAFDPEQTTMPGSDGAQLDVVRMRLHFDKPIETALFDYFHPTVTA